MLARRLQCLENLYRTARKTIWQGLRQVREQFPPADRVGSVLIFNILGGKYRLITTVNYARQTIFVKALLLEELVIPERELSAEEDALAAFFENLVADYDDKCYAIPEGNPHEILRFLMEQRNLKQADLVPVIGSRAQVSDLVIGKRGISKARAKKLAGGFHISAELFI